MPAPQIAPESHHGPHPGSLPNLNVHAPCFGDRYKLPTLASAVSEHILESLVVTKKLPIFLSDWFRPLSLSKLEEAVSQSQRRLILTVWVSDALL